MSQLTRDRLTDAEDAVNMLFYDKIFNVLMDSTDEINRNYSYDILANIVASQTQRHKLAS